MKKVIYVFVIILFTLSCTSCKKNYYNPDEQQTPIQTKVMIKEITLNYNKASLSIGETMMIAAAISPANASDKPIKFQSSNNKILSINDKGIVFAKKEGTATVTVCSAEDEKIQAKCQVTVLPLRKAIITGKVPLASDAGVSYTVTVSFENCVNPSVKVIADCKGGKIKGENDTISFNSSSVQYQVMGKTTIDFSISELKDINSIRILCFDNGDLIDSKEYNITLIKKE